MVGGLNDGVAIIDRLDTMFANTTRRVGNQMEATRSDQRTGKGTE